jgi:hypothetical protein
MININYKSISIKSKNYYKINKINFIKLTPSSLNKSSNKLSYKNPSKYKYKSLKLFQDPKELFKKLSKSKSLNISKSKNLSRSHNPTNHQDKLLKLFKSLPISKNKNQSLTMFKNLSIIKKLYKSQFKYHQFKSQSMLIDSFHKIGKSNLININHKYNNYQNLTKSFLDKTIN